MPNLGRIVKTGSHFPPNGASGVIPKTFEGEVDEERGTEAPAVPSHRTKGTDTTHWIPAMRARQTDSSG